MRSRAVRDILILGALSGLLLFAGNGSLSLTSPDEVFYAQTAKEMSERGSWFTPYLFDAPQFEKPILLYWLLRAASAIFPNQDFAARFFPALFGVLGVIAVYLLALIGWQDEKRAFVPALVLLSSGLYVGLGKSVFTDMIFSVFILLSLLAFYWGYAHAGARRAGFLLFFVCAALATLTKGPLGLLIPALVVTVFLALKGELRRLADRRMLWGLALFALIALPWYLLMMVRHGSAFTHEFFYNDHYRRLVVAEHPRNDTWYFYPAIMIGCMFPWCFHTLGGLALQARILRHEKSSLGLFAIAWIGVVFVVFQVAHSKLMSYIFPMFPALAIVTGAFIHEARASRAGGLILRAASALTALLLLAVPTAVVIVAPRFADYVSSPVFLYVGIGVLYLLAVLFIWLLFKGRFAAAVLVPALLIPALMVTAPSFLDSLEPRVSSKRACAFLLDNEKVTGPIVCSRTLVRGVRYYTGREVAVFGSPTELYSPHPLEFLDSDGKVREFLGRRDVTYCILTRSSTERMERIVKGAFGMTVLTAIGNEYVIEVRRPVSAPDRPAEKPPAASAAILTRPGAPREAPSARDAGATGGRARR